MPLDDLPSPQDGAPDPAAAAPDPGSAPAPAAPAGLPSPFADVVAGSIPAVLVPPIGPHGKPDPVQEFAANNFSDLLQAGLSWHETKDQAVVLFNPKLISEAKVIAADKAGTLSKIAQPVTSLQAPGGPPAAPDATLADPAAAAAAPAPDAGPLAAAPAPMPASGGVPASVPPGVLRARGTALAPKKVSPIQPNPIADQLARRAV